MSKPRIRVGADRPVMVALPEEFTQPTLKALYENISACRLAGTFQGIDGSAVKRTDGAGVQFLLACFASPAEPDADTHVNASAMCSPVLITSERLLSAIAALGALQLLDSCVVEASVDEAAEQKLAA